MAGDAVGGRAQSAAHRQHLGIPAIRRVRHVLGTPPRDMEQIHNRLGRPAVEVRIHGVNVRGDGGTFASREHQPQQAVLPGESSGVLDIPKRNGHVFERMR